MAFLWLALGMEPCLGHGVHITCLGQYWGRNMQVLGSGLFLGMVEWSRGVRGSLVQYKLKTNAFRGRRVPTQVSPGRGESPTYSHVSPGK